MSGISLITLPIGNKDDITKRAISTLEAHKYIYCEDTRVFKDLCQRTGFDYSEKEIRSYHDHSSEQALAKLLQVAVEFGLCFVSDAGSPIVSDPAFPIIEKAIEQGVEIESIGGVSAVITALELSGLPPIPFHFHGFLPRDGGKINTALDIVNQQYGTHLFFEGVSRAQKTIQLIGEKFPEFNIAVCRELTKEHQSIHRFKGEQVSDVIGDITFKGEFVLAINNSNKSSAKGSGDLLKLAEEIIAKGAKPKTLAKLLAQITDKNSKEIYGKLTQD